MKSFSASEKNMERRRSEQMRRYYEEVVQALKEADRIVLMGPGEAKNELAKELKQGNLASHLAEVITSEEMTERQLVAAVKECFH